MTFSKNLKLLREENGISQKELAKMAGVSQAAIHYWEKGTRTPKMGQLRYIAVALNVPIAKLLDQNTLNIADDVISILDDGPPKYLGTASVRTTQENYLLISFRNLNQSGQVKAMEQIELLSKIPEYQKEPASAPENNIIVLPYSRGGVSAGAGIFILGNEAEDEIELRDLPEYEGADFAVDVDGSSMEPDFFAADIALVQQDAELSPGDIGVFVINGDAFIKELGENELISRNKDYKNIPIHEGDNVVCMGKVIGKVKTDEE